MKKIISLALVLTFMLILVAGCGTTATTTVSTTVGTTTASAGGTTTAGTTSAATTSSPSASEFILGVVSPLTGSGATSGAVQANAVKLAVNEINAAGGINGTIPIKLISEDDEGVPAKSVTVTQKLVNQDKIHAMIGALNSSCTLANMEVTKAAKIPQITPSSSNATITEQGNQFIFRMTATDTTHARTLLKYASESMKAKKVAMIYETSDFGTGAFNIVNGLVNEYGLEMVTSEVYNSGETDFSVQLTKLKNAAPDVIILWGYYTEAAQIRKQVKQYAIDIPMIGTGYNSPALIELGGEAVDGLIFTTAFTNANPDPKVQAFDKKYMEQMKSSYDQNAPQSYDTVYIIADAVTRAIKDGKDWSNGEVLRGYIASTKDYNGATGITNFDEKGEMLKDLMVVKIVDGKHSIVNW